jgi:serine/threonine protein kinase/tetratricopeptide (TPR) repeat protein
MPFFHCPGCQVKLSAKPEFAGRKFFCPQCRTVITAPAADSSRTSPSGALSLSEKAASSASLPRDAAPAPAAKSAPAWSPGLVLLDDYLVEQHLGSGGMGDVYLARSRTTGEPYAVKRIRPDLIQDPRHRKSFLKELRSWVDLPGHPHLVACRFFRTVSGEVLIFAEYVEGGSLHAWIREGRVSSVEAVLDVAIQVAWGLEAAHQQGLIHQDVKPANVLLYDDLFLEDFRHAKVTDFGLANARAVIRAGQPAPGPSSATPKAKKTAGAGTPAYCSPEQAAGVTVSPRADIWGFGVSLLETLLGKRTWVRGVEAAKNLPHLIDEHRGGARVFHVPPPDSLLTVLARCLEWYPADRWPSMRELAGALIEIFAAQTGHPYPRPTPEITRTRPAATYVRRNGQGLAWSDPAVWLEKALRLSGTDASPSDWLLGSSPGSRRARAIDDLIGYEEAYDVYARRVARGDRHLESELASLAFEKALVHETAGDVTGALVLHDRAIGLYESLANERSAASVGRLETCYACKAQLQTELGNHRAAAELFDKAIALADNGKLSGGRPPNAASLVAAYAGKGLVATKCEDYAAAVEGFDRAIAILERPVELGRPVEHQEELANLLRDKALVLTRYGQIAGRRSSQTLDQHLRQSIALYDKAIALYEGAVLPCDRPGKEEALRERAIHQARCYSNQGNALWHLGDARAAYRAYDDALAFLNPLERKYVEREQAVARMNKAVAQGDLEGEGEAMVGYGQAAEALERLVRRGSRRELSRELAVCAMNQGCALAAFGNDLMASAWLDRAAKLIEQDVQGEPTGSAQEDLAQCYMNKSVPLGRRGQFAAAIELLNRAIGIFDALARQGRPTLPADAGLCWMTLGTQLWRSGKREAGMESYDRAIELIDAWLDHKGPSQAAADLALCHLNKALAYHQLGRSWYAGRALRRAGQFVFRPASPDARPAPSDAALTPLFVLFSKHEGSPGRAAVREFLDRQTALASGGALNRTHKQTLDLL